MYFSGCKQLHDDFFKVQIYVNIQESAILRVVVPINLVKVLRDAVASKV